MKLFVFSIWVISSMRWEKWREKRVWRKKIQSSVLAVLV